MIMTPEKIASPWKTRLKVHGWSIGKAAFLAGAFGYHLRVLLLDLGGVNK